MYIAGSKRGQLRMFDFDGGSLKHIGKILNEESSSGVNPKKSTVPYPIYSLLHHCHNDRQYIFAGSGDRYINVWFSTRISDTAVASWSLQQRLGPHTGWVKALAMDTTTHQLYSIGCNCIETWTLDSTIDNSLHWKHHQKTRSVESSPDQGSTLSSDLLCLGIWNTNKRRPTILVTGGVDGRFHIWDSISPNPLRSTTTVHNGRVSALEIVPFADANDDDGKSGTPHNASESCLIVSVGYDGMLQCRRLNVLFETRCNEEATIQALDLFKIGCVLVGNDDENEGPTNRLTAMECTRVSANLVRVCLGSTSGTLYRMSISTTNDWKSACLTNSDTEPMCVVGQGKPMIYAIATISSSADDTMAIVGHSQGLSTVNCQLGDL